MPCKPVSKPLAASLLLTHCTSDLNAFFRGCTLFRLYEKDFRDGGLQASTRRRKRKRSGKRPAHQAGRRMHAQAYLVVETNPPATRTASFFLHSFFADEERMEPPEGASPAAWKKLG